MVKMDGLLLRVYWSLLINRGLIESVGSGAHSLRAAQIPFFKLFDGLTMAPLGQGLTE
jgi:hypothetical protein